MSRPLLPPRGIFTGTRWLYDPQLSPNIKETLLQLMALTWGSERHLTPPLSYAQLEALTHKDARTLRGHFSALRTYHAALRLQRAGAGQFIIALAGWLFRNDDPHFAAPVIGELNGKVLPVPVNDQNQEEEEIYPDMDEILLLPLNHDQAQSETQTKSAPAGKKRGKARAERKNAPPSGLSARFEQRLCEAGMFPVLLPEIRARAAQAGYREEELGALLEWCQADQPQQAAALFVGRLRAGARAPAAYSTPACPRCGSHGKHAPDCPRRYQMDTP